MPNPTVVMIGAQLVGSILQSRGAKKAGEAQERAAESGIGEQRAARESFEARTEPFRQLGLSAAGPLAELLGLSAPEGSRIQQEIDALDEQIAGLQSQNVSQEALAIIRGRVQGVSGGGPIPNQLIQSPQLAGLQQRRSELAAQLEGLPVQQGFQPSQSEIERINPVLSFLRDEGFEAIQESAAARGRLGAGGTLKDLTEFNTNLASTVVPQLQNQRFNQLFNILGLGANTATGQGTAALQTASNIGNLLGNIGSAQADTAINQTNIRTDFLGNMAGFAGYLGGTGTIETIPPRAGTIETIPPAFNFLGR